jgi:cell wall-associated NlpC family hydrolase
MRLDEATTALNTLEQQVDATQARVRGVKALVQARAARLYRGAASGGMADVLDVGNVNELGRRTQYVDAAAKPDRALLRHLSETLDRLAAEQQSAEAARTRLRAEADAAAAARRKLLAEAAAAAAAHRTQTGDGAGPMGTPRAIPVASSSARTGANPSTTPKPAPSPTSPPTSAPPPSSPPPAPSSRAAVAVAYARAQLGKPYVFATSGPNTFDCSGLTMAAWRAAGVSMAHYSGSQATAFPHVGWNDLQPGDIVVFYSDWHHVGLYVGGGTMIHAPQTGDVVKYAPAWRETFQFGVRPG